MEHSFSTPTQEMPVTPTLDLPMFRKIADTFHHGEYKTARDLLLSLHHVDIAHFLALCAPEVRKEAVSAIRDDFTAELLLALDGGVIEEVIEILGIAECTAIIARMESNDAIYILEDLSDSLQERLLQALPKNISQTLRDQLSYPEHSAGRLMHRQLVSVMDYWNVGQICDYLRYNRSIPENFYEIFVLNTKYQPIGAVSASRLLCTDRDTPVTKIMNEDFKIIQAELDQEEVSYLFTEYMLKSAPVVNRDGRLVGVISLEDVVEVIEEEAEEDILRLGGVEGSDIHTSVIKTASKRLPWLLLNLCMSITTCSIIRLFEDTLGAMVALAAIMPIVASMGGNAGTQSLTVAVRSIATKELSRVNAFRVLGKEFIASLINGVFCAFIGGVCIFVWQQDIDVTLVFSCAIIINFTIASIMGVLIPLLMIRLKIDPAIASGIFVTGMTDAVGFFVFLSLSSWLIF